MTLYSWRLASFCSYFLITLLALLIFLYLTNTDMQGILGLKTL